MVWSKPIPPYPSHTYISPFFLAITQSTHPSSYSSHTSISSFFVSITHIHLTLSVVLVSGDFPVPTWPSLVRVTSSGSVDSIQNNSRGGVSRQGGHHTNCEALFNVSSGGDVTINELDTTNNGPVTKRAKTATVAAITA